MKYWGMFFLLLSTWVSASPVPPEWNPDGANMYRLFRISLPQTMESISTDFDALVARTHADQNLDDEQARARLAVIHGARQLLTDELYSRLYRTFSDALDNRYLKAAPDLTIPNIDPLFVEHASKAANPVAEGKGAGLVHYAYFHEFFTLQRANPPELHASTFEELSRAFNIYLTKKGITGLQFQLEREISSKAKPKPGFFADFWGHLPMMKVAVLGGAVTCATLVGGATMYSGYFGNESFRAPTPSQEVHQMQEEKIDPQVEANRDALDFGREMAPLFTQPLP